jgi:hypothetical protein
MFNVKSGVAAIIFAAFLSPAAAQSEAQDMAKLRAELAQDPEKERYFFAFMKAKMAHARDEQPSEISDDEALRFFLQLRAAERRGMPLDDALR